ncbi:hypothetical protein HORIV_34110 [Vreelandella olivaria]|uniref:Electron transfer flavoprotein alpha/beta-subunit N-terminal domain-containing protein n=1 Tax=Vreelandella olivaria TaxID=390919 RepID=A0ABM7GK91_9GAMM|nr:hypothetical protein HORIV_34110 [Halomonas olivaria]
MSDVIAVESADTFKRPIYAGNAIATVKSDDALKVITVRSTGFDAVGTSGSATTEAVDVVVDNSQSSFVKEELAQSDRPELGGAKVVISGGRGMGNGENFKLLDGIADKLGLPSVLPGPRSTQALYPTICRSVRPVRSSPRICISPWAFPVLSST